MRAFKIVLFLFIGLVLIAVAAVVALIFVDPSVYRNQLESRASAVFDRPFKIDGPIRLEKSLRPRIILEDITIGNPDWAVGMHFATADKLGLQVALFPLLWGNLRILDVSFSGVNLFIEEGPDGVNNYTFGDRGQGERAGVLPPIERLLVKDTVINYQTLADSSNRFEIKEARLWNLPGEPERIEARGTAKGKKFSLLLAADNSAELTGPQNPWSVKLDIQGPDVVLTIAGQMVEAFKWERGDYRIKLSGQQADSLENLFDVKFPTTGPFELSANVNKDAASFKMTDIAALVNGPPGTPALKISQGEATGGQNDPLQIALQGQFGETPFGFTFSSKQPFGGISQATPWPIEAGLNLADIKLNIAGALTPAMFSERLEFDTQLRGETFDTLAQLLDTELPEAGPYQFSFQTQIFAKRIAVSKLEGTIERVGPWQMVNILSGEASVHEKEPVRASLDAKLDNLPLSLTFEGGPEALDGSGKRSWPLKLKAAAPGATLTGDGAIVTAEDQKVLQMATRIKGQRFESLSPLISVSLPAIGKFNLSADIRTDGEVHTADNLKIQLGSNRLSGNLRWEDKALRPTLRGKLFSERLILKKFFDAPAKRSSKSEKASLLDRPIKLDSLKGFDARLDLAVKHLADSPIDVMNLKSTLTLADGELNAPFGANLAGAPVDGQFRLRQGKNLPTVSLKAKVGKIDAGQALRQLKIPEIIVGTADAVDVDGSSTGKTLRTLGERASVTIHIDPANLNYTAEIADSTTDFEIESATIVARNKQPLTGTLSGNVRGVAFKAEASIANLRELRQKADIPLSLRLALQTEDFQFKAEGSIARPFKKKEFELEYEMSGTEIEGIDPLVDFTIPLRGEFSARGRIAGRGNRFTYEEDLRVGKRDLKAEIAVLREAPRPKITGHIVASQIHMDDVDIFDADKEAAANTEKSRVIPNYTLPVDALLAADLDLDVKAERILAPLGDLGEFVTKVNLKDGRLKSSLNVTGFRGARINSEFDLNAVVDPPQAHVQINAKDLNFGYFLSKMGITDLIEGQVNLFVDISGAGATRYSFLENAVGRITLIGGPGQIAGRRIDLWAADLIPTMLSTSWQRDDVTETNCMVAHIELKEGLAEIEDLLLDTQRITVAASGILDLKTEELNLVIAPRPKRPSLVSLANPVRIEGTLGAPEVSVTRIPRGSRLAAGGGASLLAGLVNPVFLIFALSDTGTGQANLCDAAVEKAREVAGIDAQ